MRKLKDLTAPDTAMPPITTNSINGGESPDFLDDFDQRRRRAADLPDGTIFTTPAHTRMCSAILSRLDAYDLGTTRSSLPSQSMSVVTRMPRTLL